MTIRGFWKCAASRVPKPTRDHTKTAPYIEYTGETAMLSPSPPPPAAQGLNSPPHIRREAVRATRIQTAAKVCDVRQPDFQASDSVKAGEASSES